MSGTLRISFDIGGVLSKYPDIFRRLALALAESEDIELFVLTDMHDHEKSVRMLYENGFTMIRSENVINSDYNCHGELCKAEKQRELGIDIHIDDFIGYVAEGCPVRLLIMPNAGEPYYHDDWKTDGSEGEFGRRRKATP